MSNAHTTDYILELWTDEREELEALAFALVQMLEPADPKNPQDTDKIYAWRLADMLYEKMGDTSQTNGIRRMVAEEHAIKPQGGGRP